MTREQLRIGQAVPLTWAVDLSHGGRWTSLRTGDREWLWANPEPAVVAARSTVMAGAGFVDAGGGEECWPTVRGVPDHGDAWSRPWSGQAGDAWVDVPGLGRLRRRVRGSTPVEVDYEVTGRSGTPFLHGVHLLLDVGPEAELVIPGAVGMQVLDSDAADRRWPDGLDRLGPDDGTAVCALIPLPRSADAWLVDRDQVLHLRWSSPDLPDHRSLLLWRNLRGWPTDAPYRSIGVEPMLGRAADWQTAAPDDLARIGSTGRARWSLRLAAHRRR